MSKGDGIGIRVNFSDVLTSIAAADAGCFTVSFNVPTYVPGGTLEAVSKTPVSISHPSVVKETVDFSAGTMTDTQIVDGALCLAKQS